MRSRLTLNLLTTVVVERLAVVDITTGQGDNAHRIFQSLNATGVNLTQADLLRNLIFMLLPTRAGEVYDEVWRPMERLIGFDNLEGLARVDLQRRGMDVAVDDVFRRHQDRLEAMSGGEAAVEEAVRDLALRARHYKRIIDPGAEDDQELRAGLWRLRRWGAQTSYPVLMAAYDLRERGLLTIEGMREVVSYIESFLVRRQLAGIPTNALNRLFVQFVEHLPQDESFPQALRRSCPGSAATGPADEQLREAIRTRPFYLSGRGPQRKVILERLEQSYGHPEQIDFEISDLTIEHVLPQTLSQEWREHLASLGQDPDEVHRDLVHTLGNLTLTAFNGTLSNNPFERKRQIYSGSHLELNHALARERCLGTRGDPRARRRTGRPRHRRSGQARYRARPSRRAVSTGAGSTPPSPPSREAAGRPTATWPSSAAPPPCQSASTSPTRPASTTATGSSAPTGNRAPTSTGTAQMTLAT